MAKDLSRKQINLASEIYIHYNNENFKDYKKKLGYNIDWSLVSQVYKQDAEVLKARMEQLNSITGKDGQTVATALGLLNDLNGRSSVFNDMINKMSNEVAEIVRKGLTETYITDRALRQSQNDVQNQIQILDNYIGTIKQVITEYEKNNDDYMNYILQMYKGDSQALSNINKLYSTGNKLNLLQINKTAMTSFENLKKRATELESIRNSLGTGSEERTVLSSKGKAVDYISAIYPMHYLFSNILGGIGEGVGATVVLQALDEIFMDLKSDNITVEMEGTGTTKAETGSTNKADYSIQIGDGTVSLSFGVSAKAQALNKGKKVTTTFETVKLGKIMNQYLASEHVDQYLFYNNLYHGTRDNIDYYIRRKIAANYMLHAVTGIDQGENVLFLQYLNDLVRVDELFEGLSKAAPSELPNLSIAKAKEVKSSDFIKNSKLKNALRTEEGFEDLNPEDKNVLAWVRSRQVIKALNELTTQVQLQH